MWLRHGHVVFKSSIFVVQKPTAPKNGVEFRQSSIGTIRSSLATSYDLAMSPIFNQSEAEKLSHTNKLTNLHRINILSGPALRTAPAKIMKKKLGTNWEQVVNKSWASHRKTKSSCFNVKPNFCNLREVIVKLVKKFLKHSVVCFFYKVVRGGVIIKKRENCGLFPK